MNPEKLDKLITAVGDLKPSPAAIDSPRMMMVAKSIHAEEADDETYALPADKGVVVQAIPDDQMPTDAEGVKAELLIPEGLAPFSRGLSICHTASDLINAEEAFTHSLGFPSHAVIPVYAKPKARINRQRQGYSRRKAKRAYQTRAAHQVKLTRYKRRGRGYMLLLDENGNPVNLKSGIIIKQAMGRAAAGSYMKATKPSGFGKGNLNG